MLLILNERQYDVKNETHLVIFLQTLTDVLILMSRLTTTSVDDNTWLRDTDRREYV